MGTTKPNWVSLISVKVNSQIQTMREFFGRIFTLSDLLPGARRRKLFRRLAQEIAKDLPKNCRVEAVARPDDRVQDVAARPDDRVQDDAGRPDDRVQDVAARPDDRVQDVARQNPNGTLFLAISRGRRVTRRRGRLFRQLEVPSLLELAGRVVVENGLDLSELPTHLAEILQNDCAFLN